ncbi:MAG: hypothetical protein ACRDO7_16285, partial [Nocardioidaceae bacterium]
MRDSGLFMFARPQHDRRSDLRVDDARVDRAWRDPRARVLVVGRKQVATEQGALRWIVPGQAPEGERIYLGEVDGTTYLAVAVDDVDNDLDPLSLREAALSLSET